MKRKKIILLMLTLNIVFALAHAHILVSTACPSTVYMNELFTCSVTLYNDSTAKTELSYYAHFSKSLAEVDNAKAEVLLDPYARKQIDFNCWARDTGTDVFLFEYGVPKIRNFSGSTVLFTSSPVILDLKDVTITAGKKNVIKTEVSGKGAFVEIELRLPASILGTKYIDVGDVDGSTPITIELSPDPFAVGAHTAYAYIRFTDERGDHIIKQKINITVAPSFQVLGFALFALAAVVAVYLALRRRKTKEES